LVSLRALQVTTGPGTARDTDSTQAGTEQAPRSGDEPSGHLAGFGLKVGGTTPRNFEARVRELIEGHTTLLVVADAMLLARSVLTEQLGKLQ
jgi:hypothetical protein